MTRPAKYPELHDRNALEKLIEEYGTDGAVARELGCDTSAVARARYRFGLESNWKAYPELHERRTMKKLMAVCSTDKEIAREIGCSISAVAWNRRRLGYKKRRGSQVVKYPLLHDPVALKVLMGECGSYTELAQKVGCGLDTALWACRRGGVKLPRTEKEK